MSRLQQRNLAILKTLQHLSPARRKAFLSNCPKDTIEALCEISLNLLKGRIPLSKSQYGKLKRHKEAIKLFADKKTALKRKQQILRQRGGFIPLLLATVLPIITSLITGR